VHPASASASGLSDDSAGVRILLVGVESILHTSNRCRYLSSQLPLCPCDTLRTDDRPGRASVRERHFGCRKGVVVGFGAGHNSATDVKMIMRAYKITSTWQLKM
jgi:hypothetical protein